jgi:hypothetical protein
MAYQYPLNGGRINASIGGNSTSAGAGYQLVSTGTMLLAGGNNITLSQNGQSISIVGGGGGAAAFSAGISSNSTVSNQIIFAAGNNVTLSQSTNATGATLSIGASNQSVQSIGFYATGANTTGQSSSNTLDARSVNISAMGGLYAGMSGSTLQLSAATTYAASNHSHGNPTLNLTNLSGTTASASNGLTISLSAAAPGAGGGVALYDGANSISSGTARISAGGAITASINGQTLSLNAPAQSNLSATGAVSISTNGATISIGAPTQTNQSLGIYATGANTTGQSSSNTLDARSFNISGQGGIYVGMSGSTLQMSVATQTVQTQSNIQGIIASGSTNRTGDISFANSNGVTFGLSSNTLTASVAGASAGIGALANSQTTYTSGTVRLVEGSGAITINSSVNGASQSYKFNVPATSSMSATGALSISTNGSTVSIGVPAQTNQNMSLYALGNTTQNSSTLLNASNLSFNGLNGISVGFSNGSIQLSGATGGAGGGGVALYDGANSISSGTARVSAGGALTASVNGQTLSLNVPAQSTITAAGAINLSSNGSTITISAPLNGTISNWEPAPFNQITTGSTALGSAGASQMFYKLVPQAYVSASQFIQMISASLSTSSNSSYAGTITVGAGIYTATGSTLSLITQSSGSASYTWSNTSNNLSGSLSGLRALTLPMTVSMSPGNYWLGMWSRTSSTRANWATFANVVATGGGAVTFGGPFFAAANATQGIQEGVGYYNATTAGLMASAAMSSITQSNVVSNQMQYVAFKNQTW